MSPARVVENGSESSVAPAQRAVRDNPAWYHTIDLAPGVASPGAVDLREVAAKLLPEDLSGKRALDVDKVEAAEWPPASRPEMERRAHEWGWTWAADSSWRRSSSARVSGV